MKIKNAVFTVLLTAYIGFVLTITLIERISTPAAHYMSEPFWSYKLILAGSESLLIEDILNVVLFILVGICISALVKKRPLATAFFFGVAFSSVVELTQLFSHRGLFEYDDIVHNTMGSFFGGIITVIICRMMIICRKKEIDNE